MTKIITVLRIIYRLFIPINTIDTDWTSPPIFPVCFASAVTILCWPEILPMDLTFNLCLHTNLKATKQSIANWLKCDDLRNPHPSTPTIYYTYMGGLFSFSFIWSVYMYNYIWEFYLTNWRQKIAKILDVETLKVLNVFPEYSDWISHTTRHVHFAIHRICNKVSRLKMNIQIISMIWDIADANHSFYWNFHETGYYSFVFFTVCS